MSRAPHPQDIINFEECERSFWPLETLGTNVQLHIMMKIPFQGHLDFSSYSFTANFWQTQNQLYDNLWDNSNSKKVSFFHRLLLLLATWTPTVNTLLFQSLPTLSLGGKLKQRLNEISHIASLETYSVLSHSETTTGCFAQSFLKVRVGVLRSRNEPAALDWVYVNTSCSVTKGCKFPFIKQSCQFIHYLHKTEILTKLQTRFWRILHNSFVSLLLFFLV